MPNLISIGELSKALARRLVQGEPKHKPITKGLTLASVFLEPSTRTRLHFEHAAHQLGMHVLSVADVAQTRIPKGETVADTAEMLKSVADVVVLRSPERGHIYTFAEVLKGSKTQLINAGNGNEHHPSQGLQDYLAMVSQASPPFKIWMIANPYTMRAARSFYETLLKHNARAHVNIVWPTPIGGGRWTPDLAKGLEGCNVVYMNSMSRPGSGEVYSPNPYAVYPGMKGLSKTALILHPLARHDELSTAFDETNQNGYFYQAKIGPRVKKACILYSLGAY